MTTGFPRSSEKPVHRFLVNAGIYVLEPAAVALVPSGVAYDMPALFDRLARNDERQVFFRSRSIGSTSAGWMISTRPTTIMSASSGRDEGLSRMIDREIRSGADPGARRLQRACRTRTFANSRGSR